MNGDKIDYMDYIIKSVPIIISLVALFHIDITRKRIKLRKPLNLPIIIRN